MSLLEKQFENKKTCDITSVGFKSRSGNSDLVDVQTYSTSTKSHLPDLSCKISDKSKRYLIEDLTA